MPTNEPTTRFGLIRHASTRWNRQKRIQGQKDSPLTEEGIACALKWGGLLTLYPWDRIVASDLGRTVCTAALVNESLKVPVEHDPRLREQDWGKWTGGTLTRLRTAASEHFARQEAAGWQFCPPGGEPRIAVWERGSQALVEAAGKWPGKTILVVTHEGVIKSLIYRLCGRRFVPGEPPLLSSKIRQLHWLASEGGRLKVERINALALP